MTTSIEPRWFDAAGAAAYVSLTESAFRRRVASGVFPKPTYFAGQMSPRWDRLALDAAFGGGVESTDTRTAFKGLVDALAKNKGRPGSQAHASGRHG
jgi:hypothetical protein